MRLSDERDMQGSAQFSISVQAEKRYNALFGVLNYNLDTYMYDVVGTAFKNG